MCHVDNIPQSNWQFYIFFPSGKIMHCLTDGNLSLIKFGNNPQQMLASYLPSSLTPIHTHMDRKQLTQQ